MLDPQIFGQSLLQFVMKLPGIGEPFVPPDLSGYGINSSSGSMWGWVK
jgi:hypothetical protein